MIVYPTRCSHGESPVWDAQTSRLYCVDIEVGCGLIIDARGAVTKIFEGRNLTSVVLAESGDCVFGDHNSLWTGGKRKLSIFPPLINGARLNEAKVDVNGNLWVASMDLAEAHPVGVLYKIDPRGVCSQIFSGLTVGNGIGWNIDQSKMYLTDSAIGVIHCFDFSTNTSEISNRRVFATIPRHFGLPDGLAVDHDGGVWSAHYNGGMLTRYLSSGEIDFTIPLPAKSPTSLCFGGPNLSDLFVTTSTMGSSDERPYDGFILRITTAFRGVKPSRFKDREIEI